MSAKIKFPIRWKLLFLMSALALISIVTYLALAIKLFQDDKTTLIYELNAGTVRTFAAELRSELQRASDKVKLLTQGHRNPEWMRIVLSQEKELLGFSLYKNGSREFTIDHSQEYRSFYSVSEAEWLDEVKKIEIPFDKIIEQKTWVSARLIKNQIPVLLYGMLIKTDDSSAVPSIAVAQYRLDRIFEEVRNRGVATLSVVNRDGELIAHPQLSLFANWKPSEFVKTAIQSTLTLEIKRVEENGENWLVAYADVGLGGLKVISQVPEQQVFRAAMRLIQKSILFALLIVTIALLISTRMARSVTEPLNELVDATEKMSRWEFAEKLHVNTNDEVGELARAFNVMAQDLKGQREQIDKHQAELEQKVKDRTIDLETQKRRAAEANEALVRTTRLASLGELAGSAAHEVLNPVNNMNLRISRMKSQVTQKDAQDFEILKQIVDGWGKAYREKGWAGLQESLATTVEGSTKTLIEEDLENLAGIVQDTIKRTEERQSDFSFLDHEIVRITKIVNNMRSLARVQGDRRRMNIHVAIEDTINALSDIAEKYKTKLVLQKGEDSHNYFVHADKDELMQVFTNLIRNAFQAMAQAKTVNAQVTVSTIMQNGRVEIRVSNNGPEIPQEHLPRIFEPDFTTKSVEEGTGLGLSISRRIIRAFSGDLDVESTNASGTTFLAWVPFANEQQQEAKA